MSFLYFHQLFKFSHFHPYLPDRKESIAGRIVVHDRSQVESEILPRYFNHSSFASLRRQLNYFAFSREGKGKQKGATYTNNLVFDLEDITRLKRRLPGSSAPLVPQVAIPRAKTVVKQESVITTKRSHSSKSRRDAKRRKTSKKVRKIINSVVPVVHVATEDAYEFESRTDVVHRSSPATAISPPPADAPSSKGTTPQVLLDLTKPEESEDSSSFQSAGSTTKSGPWPFQPVAISRDVSFILPQSAGMAEKKEEDVIAGCSALLSLGWQKQTSD